MSRVTVVTSTLVICIIACSSWAVDNYHDDTIIYKAQRDKVMSIIASMQKHRRNVAELDTRYIKGLADANTTTGSLHTDVSAGHKRL